MSDALYAAIAQEEARKIAGPAAQERATEVAAEVAERTTVAQLPAKVADYLRANPPRPGEPGLTWQGRWQASATYSPGDAVEIEGSSYVAIHTTHDERPPSSPSWELLARRGDPGPPGVMGPGGGGGPGVTPTLAQVLAQGNDTGGTAIVNSQATASTTLTATDPATGNTGLANANVTAQDGDGSVAIYLAQILAGDAIADTTVASNERGARANTTVTSFGTLGSADTIVQVFGDGGAGSANRTVTIDTGSGTATADTTATSDEGHASAQATATAAAGGNATVARSATTSNGDATADTTATSTGGGTATAVSTATAAGGSASIGPVATATTAEIQVNGLPLYTTAAAGPPGSFASLFYVDSTAVTGGTWLWDFVTAAYVRIAGVF